MKKKIKISRFCYVLHVECDVRINTGMFISFLNEKLEAAGKQHTVLHKNRAVCICPHQPSTYFFCLLSFRRRRLRDGCIGQDENKGINFSSITVLKETVVCSC